MVAISSSSDQECGENGAAAVAAVIGFKDRIALDPAYPGGTPRKLLGFSRLTSLGWQARTPLHKGLQKTYDWYCRSSWAEEA
jgi:nucleoside-diphosphate-sugar epimerase